jgi:hypothetical protein
MFYLIDIHHKPPMVVLSTEDARQLDEVGQRYADQVNRPLVITTGPHPSDAHFRPAVPHYEPVVAGVGANPAHVAPPHPVVETVVDTVGHAHRSSEHAHPETKAKE